MPYSWKIYAIIDVLYIIICNCFLWGIMGNDILYTKLYRQTCFKFRCHHSLSFDLVNILKHPSLRFLICKMGMIQHLCTDYFEELTEIMPDIFAQ